MECLSRTRPAAVGRSSNYGLAFFDLNRVRHKPFSASMKEMEGGGVRRPELQEIRREREEIKEENNNKLCTVITTGTMINSSGNECR